MFSVGNDLAAIIERQLPTLVAGHDARHGKDRSWLAIDSKYEVAGTEVPHLGPTFRRRNHTLSVESLCRPLPPRQKTPLWPLCRGKSAAFPSASTDKTESLPSPPSIPVGW